MLHWRQWKHCIAWAGCIGTYWLVSKPIKRSYFPYSPLEIGLQVIITGYWLFSYLYREIQSPRSHSAGRACETCAWTEGFVFLCTGTKTVSIPFITWFGEKQCFFTQNIERSTMALKMAFPLPLNFSCVNSALYVALTSMKTLHCMSGLYRYILTGF